MKLKKYFEDQNLKITVPESLDVHSVASIWSELEEIIKSDSYRVLIIELAHLKYFDGAGVSCLLHCEDMVLKAGKKIELIGLKSEYKKLMTIYGDLDGEDFIKEEELYTNIPLYLGQATYGLLEKFYMQIAFIGEILYEFLLFLINPFRLRWKDCFKIMELVGANAVFIIGLIGFLLGLILAFQAAIPMRQFGVEIFVANLVGLSLVRELGPLITCVILAGRSGSAYAAEIGTMKVNEELDALTTMGLSPIKFLVLPRMIAMFFVTPFLSIYFIFAGLIGGSVVLLSMGYPLVAYTNQVIKAVGIGDALGGIMKAMVFAIIVAAVGCYQGIITGSGAQAVGISTTKAVVIGIIMIAITDGAFAVLFYVLGI